eukprot:scaffold312_cov90-Alexandrium_tamarense.AAC.2
MSERTKRTKREPRDRCRGRKGRPKIQTDVQEGVKLRLQWCGACACFLHGENRVRIEIRH